MEYISEKHGKCEIRELTQKSLEDFMREMQGKDKLPLSVWRGDAVRFAAKRGILVSPVLTAEDVDNAKPAMVVWLAECITKTIAEAMELDPLS